MSNLQKNKNSNNWGGKRAGAGRKQLGEKKVVETTKVMRVSMGDYARIKSGRYDELMNLLYDYRLRLETTKEARTSPRWQQLGNLMTEVEDIFGTDFTSWID